MFNRLKSIITFVRIESLSGVLLLAASVVAVILSNSSGYAFYERLIHSSMLVNLPVFPLTVSSHFIVNDALMTIFFLLVGLEIKREMIDGELSNMQTALLPAIAAVGGMLIPALIYAVFNINNLNHLQGWAIPTATDIAFSLGVLSLFGKRVPFSLKIFLTALAIMDDLLAILVIAFFYTADLSLVYIGLAGGLYLLMLYLNYCKIDKLNCYLFLGLILFFLVHFSGIHATIAGVLTALCIPYKNKAGKSPLRKLEYFLHPWVGYGILPLFAFFNAGLKLSHLSTDMMTDAVALGCLLGLFVGKQLGVFLFTFCAVKLNLAQPPAKATWKQIYAVSILTGIGFTMSLFIANLAFRDQQLIEVAKFGIIMGSILSFLFGGGLLFLNQSSGFERKVGQN